MGCDATLCYSLLNDEKLLQGQTIPSDELLLDHHITRRGQFSAGEDENLLLEHLRERVNLVEISKTRTPAHLSERAKVAGAGGVADQASEDKDAEELIRRSVCPTGQTSLASYDGWKFEEILELRRSLLRELRTPVEEIKKRLEEIKRLYPEAFGEDISRPCSLRKLEIKLKDGYKIYCFLGSHHWSDRSKRSPLLLCTCSFCSTWIHIRSWHRNIRSLVSYLRNKNFHLGIFRSRSSIDPGSSLGFVYSLFMIIIHFLKCCFSNHFSFLYHLKLKIYS
jgi:hypothetical protein